MKIEEILKGSEYSLSQFSTEQIAQLENSIVDGTNENGEVVPFVNCIIRDKQIELKPEEVVRQLFLMKLTTEYGYPKERIALEYHIKSVGRDKKERDDRADIVVFTDNTKQQPYIIVEVKRPKETNGFEQLKSYCLVEGASIAVLTNGDKIEKKYVSKIDKANKTNALEEIERLPKANETLDDIINHRFTLKTLILNDTLQKETLKDVVKRLEQRFSANDSSDKSFEEIFKLIYCKLYDEFSSSDNAQEIVNQQKYQNKSIEDIDDSNFRQLEFRANGDERTVANRIKNLFAEAQKKWKGVFGENSVLDMQDSTIKSCVFELENVKLFNSNLEVIDNAFEYLVNKEQKEEMGQYFTPRHVIDMCIKMLNPQPHETMIDTASGSCGFPMHTIFYVWKNILKDKGLDVSNLFSLQNKPQECRDYVENKIFGIDFSEKCVRVGRTLNIIAGDGQSNVIYLNTLDYGNWNKQFVSDERWQKKYHNGFERLKENCVDTTTYKHFNFDILMANPPFAGDLDDTKILSQYELAKKDGALQNKMGRDTLFIERNLDFLRPGGRMAIVLPQGQMNNTTSKYIRDFIASKCRILAVVGLHKNTFIEHTGQKTSVLFVQKWDEKDCPYKEDYPIFFATMQEPTVDNQKNKIYVQEDYVELKHYSYETVKYYIRKQDNVKVTSEEYDEDINKTEYVLKKVDATSTRPERISESVFSKLDKNEQKQYKELNKKSQYAEKIDRRIDTESEKMEKYKYLERFKTIDENKKWRLRNIQYVLKKTKNEEQNNDLQPQIDIDKFLSLDVETRKKYKSEEVIGKNDQPIITFEEYNSFTDEKKKLCIPVSEVREWSERIKDTHGHIFVKHDLFNHDPELEPKGRYCKDGIAEAFIEFAKKEHLSFF